MIQAKQHSSLWIALLHIVFFVSGFSGLAYQVVWIRKFGFVFGVTAFATSAVLTAFFAGLALGSWLAGRRARLFARNPLQVYALFEIGIGAYALAIPFLLDSLNQVYAFVYPSLENSVYLLTLLRLFFSIVVLILPTTLMGATLPLITQALAERVTNITVNLSGLYAINTFGALAGAAFSGFYSIGAFGMSETTLIAVAGNFLAGIGAWLIARRCALAPGAPLAPTIATRATGGKYRALLLGLFLGGFVSLGSEVVWTRVLSLFMDRTVFAYTTILCAALFGIVIGSWLLRVGQRWIRRPLRVLALLELGIAWISFLSIALVSQAVPSQGDWGIPLSLGLILLIPNALSGAALPLAVRVYQDEFKNVAQSVGDLYSANVLGGVLGSLITGFVLLTVLGSQSTIVLLAVVSAFVALLLFRHSETSARGMMAFGAGLTALALVFFVAQPRFLFNGIQHGVFGNDPILFHEENVEGIVTVTEIGIHRAIYLNGSPQATENPGALNTHRALAHLPLVLHRNPQDVLIIGLGGGSTAGAASQHAIQNLRVVELAPGMYRGAAYFADSNYAILWNPNVTMRLADGRNYLLLTRERFDVIEADLIRPWHVGANNLYAAEYYRLVASRLKPGGFVAQWLDVGLPEKEYKLLLRTFVEVFPNTTLWGGGDYALAMPDGIAIDAALVRARFADSKLADVLVEGGYVDADAFLGSFVMGPDDIRKYLGAGPILSDNNPYLEYTRLQPTLKSVQLPRKDIRPFLKK